MEIYQVGGAVRDRLLGRPVHERDYVVVGATPQMLLDEGFKPVGKDFPVFLHPITKEEYALARTERKRGPGYTGFDCYAELDVTLEEDLKRRDLTINAMAETKEGAIIDPYHGQQDLANRILRHVSPAFSEDPVRILRVARFMARFAYLGFHIAEETLQLMSEMVHNGEVNALVSERIWREFSTALTEQNPHAFIETLRMCGALAVLCPELDILFSQPTKPDSEGECALRALSFASQCSSDAMIRFSSLMCRISETQIQKITSRWRVPRAYQELSRMASACHAQCHQAPNFTSEMTVKFLEQLDAYRRPLRFQQFLQICRADWYSRVDLAREHPNYLPETILFKALNCTQTIEAKPLLSQGLTGKALGEALRQQRIELLSKTALKANDEPGT